MKRDFSFEEINSLVNTFSEEEFSMLKEAVNERNLEEHGVGIGEIDPDNIVIDNEDVIINGHTYLYDEKQIDYLSEKLKEDEFSGNSFRMVKKSSGPTKVKITEKSRKALGKAIFH